MTDEMPAFRSAIDAKYTLHLAAFEAKRSGADPAHFFTADALWEYAGYPRHSRREELRKLFEAVIKADRVAVYPIRSFVAGDCGWDFTD